MKYRVFGRTGWQVSEIGFGAWQIGGDWGAVDDQQSIDTLLYAYEQGVNFVDTAELYGKGHSETVIGRSLKEWRGDKVYVATKAQPIVWPSPDESNPDMRGRYPRWHLRENVEASLKRLGVERIDLYQLHCWLSDGLSNLDWLETLNDLRREGKIDHIGVSIRDFRPEEGVDLAHYGLVNSIQVIFNMFEQRPASALFPAGASTSTAFIARVPLDSGSLIGNWSKGHLRNLGARQPAAYDVSRRTLRRDVGARRSAKARVRAFLSNAGGGGDALRVERARSLNAHSGHEKSRRSRHEHRLL